MLACGRLFVEKENDGNDQKHVVKSARIVAERSPGELCHSSRAGFTSQRYSCPRGREVPPGPGRGPAPGRCGGGLPPAPLAAPAQLRDAGQPPCMGYVKQGWAPEGVLEAIADMFADRVVISAST